MLLSIGVSAAFGMRWSVYGMVWRRLVKVVGLAPAELEHEYPPRFAQVLGSVALTLALVAFALGATPLGWVFTLAVATLQTVLAVTGYCLGCRLYFLRWWVPDVVTRIWTRGRRRHRRDRGPAHPVPLTTRIQPRTSGRRNGPVARTSPSRS